MSFLTRVDKDWMCSLYDRFSSIIKPRYRIEWVRCICSQEQLSVGVFVWHVWNLSERLEGGLDVMVLKNVIALVFFMFRVNRLLLRVCATVDSPSSARENNCSQVFAWNKITVSSAYDISSALCIFRLSMSFMYIVKSVGPSRLPCGTPKFIESLLLVRHSDLTYWLLYYTILWIY